MGFFQKLFGLKPANPTESFPRRLVPPQLVWDTSTRTLCGLPLDSPVADLALFGPAERFKALNEIYWVLSYPALGLELELSQGRLKRLTIFLSEDVCDPNNGFLFARPLILPANRPVTAETTPEDLTALIGPGEFHFQDEEEVIYLHPNGEARLEMSYTTDRSRLMRAEIYLNEE